MSSLNVVNVPLEYDLKTGEELLLLCDWEKHLYPHPEGGYRVTLVRKQKRTVLAHTLLQKDFRNLPPALRYCASVAQRYERDKG